MKKTLLTLLVVGLVAVAAQAAAVNYIFEETAPGTWDVSATVTGDSAGLSAYGFYVNDTAGVSWAQNRLGNYDFMLESSVGFSNGNLVAGYIGTDFNAGNFQSEGAYAITGIGVTAIDRAGAPAAVVLGVPALLGTLTTPVGLTGAEFAADGGGLFNLAGDGFLASVDTTVTVVPEPMTMSLIALGGLALIRRRK